MLSSLHTACIYEAQQQVIVVGKQIFLLVSPHTEIMGVPLFFDFQKQNRPKKIQKYHKKG